MDRKALRWFAVAMLLCLAYQVVTIMLRFCGVVVYPWTVMPGCFAAAVITTLVICNVIRDDDDDDGGCTA